MVPTSARAATNWGNQVVVVGSAGAGPNMAAEVWISQGPGEPFVAVPQQPAFSAPGNAPAGAATTGAVMDEVVGGALGLFAAGTVDGRATVWYSTGGHTWQVLTGAGSAINHFPGAVVNALLSTKAGVFAAGSYRNGGRVSGELWSSSDGIHWSNDGGWFSGAGDRVVTALVDMGATGSAEPGMLAVGGVRVGASWQPAAWISPDGFAWSETSENFPLDQEPPGSPGALVYAASGAEGRLLAVGGSPGRQRVWESSAGLAWSALGLPAGTERAGPAGTSSSLAVTAGLGDWHLGLLAASGHELMAADNLPGQPYVLFNDGSTWHEPSAGGIFGRPLPIAVPTSLVSENGRLTISVQLYRPGAVPGTGSTSVAILTSANGRSWSAANDRAFAGESLNQLLLVPEGLLAVGTVPLAGLAGGGESWTGAWAKLSTNGGTSWPRELISPQVSVGRSTGTVGPVVAVTAGRVSGSQYVIGQAGPQAVVWYSSDGSTWEAPHALDASPQLLQEHPIATCTAGNSAVVVGSLTATTSGALPAAWSSTDGNSWTAGTFSPVPPAGSTTSVDGCLWTGNGFVAYGGTGSGQDERPALWVSPDGINWQQMSSTFSSLPSPGGAGPASAASPLDGIVLGTTTWVGLSGAGDLPWQVWPAAVGGEAGALSTPVGLWSSANAGTDWQQVATGLPAFTGALFAQADVAQSIGQQVVMAGDVDGRLTVWVGSAAAT